MHNLDEILAVPGLTSIVVGPNDLAASLGYTGQPRHPEVIKAIDIVIAKARAAKVPMGIAVGDDPDVLVEWADKGVNWLAMAADFALLMRSRLAIGRAAFASFKERMPEGRRSLIVARHPHPPRFARHPLPAGRVG